MNQLFLQDPMIDKKDLWTWGFIRKKKPSRYNNSVCKKETKTWDFFSQIEYNSACKKENKIQRIKSEGSSSTWAWHGGKSISVINCSSMDLSKTDRSTFIQERFIQFEPWREIHSNWTLKRAELELEVVEQEQITKKFKRYETDNSIQPMQTVCI
jgi:hypothetical protein